MVLLSNHNICLGLETSKIYIDNMALCGHSEDSGQ